MSAVQITRSPRRPYELWVEAPAVRGYGWTLWRQKGGYAVAFATEPGDEDSESYRVTDAGTYFAWEPCQPEDMAQIDDMNDLRLIRAAHADIISSIAEEEFGISHFSDITPEIRKQIMSEQCHNS